MNVPLLDLKAHHEPIYKEILDAIEQVIQSQAFILGPSVKQLEERIAAYCQTQFAIGVSSGTDALLVALMALDVGPGDEVITSPYSFFATAGAVVRVGATPVFVDIDPATYNMDPGKTKAAITPKTKAILPVHLYGQCADMEPILKIAAQHRLKIIEDAAQAIGAEYPFGRRAGGLGDVGCFSFFPSKNLGAFGDGGVVTTNDPDLAEKIRILRVHGSNPKYYHPLIGGNFRLDTLQAAVLNVKMKYLDGWTKRRQENAKRYAEQFWQSGLIEKGFVRLPDVVYPNERQGHIYNQFVIRVRDRDNLREHLKNQRITTEVYYPVPFHLQDCFRYLGYEKGDFPLSEQAADETLALPIYPELSERQQGAVVEAIRGFHLS